MIVNYALDYIIVKYPKIRHILEGDPAVLIKNGKMNRRILSQEHVSVDELFAAMREHGIESVSEIKKATLELNGKITIVLFNHH